MEQTGTEKPLDDPQIEAAYLLAEDKLTDAQIAKRLKIGRTTLHRWKQIPAFAAKVAEFVQQTEAEILKRGIARKARRVEALHARWLKMQRIIEDRSAAPEMQHVAGGKTGLLVRQLKSIGSGPAAQVVEEFEVDTGLLKELREHEKQAAVEMGQWTEKRDVTSGGEPFKVYVGFDPDSV